MAGVLDPVDGFAVHAGSGREGDLVEVVGESEVADAGSDAFELSLFSRIVWILGHTETLEVGAVQVSTRTSPFCDLAQILIVAADTDTFARMSDLGPTDKSVS